MQSQLESQRFSEEREEMEKREMDRLLAELWQREEERERAREWDERDAESVREIACFSERRAGSALPLPPSRYRHRLLQPTVHGPFR
jgi:hypothetical protein